jgi:hypothetical protein
MMTIFRMIILLNNGHSYISNNNFDDKNKIYDVHRHYGNYGYGRGNTTAEVDSTWHHTSTKGTKNGIALTSTVVYDEEPKDTGGSPGGLGHIFK